MRRQSIETACWAEEANGTWVVVQRWAPGEIAAHVVPFRSFEAAHAAAKSAARTVGSAYEEAIGITADESERGIALAEALARFWGALELSLWGTPDWELLLGLARAWLRGVTEEKDRQDAHRP